MQVWVMSPMIISLWMPCFLSCKSKSVLAKPLEHQCSRGDNVACLRLEPGTNLAAPRAVFEALSQPRRLLNGRNVLPSLVVAWTVSMMQRIENAKPPCPRRIQDSQHI